MLKPPLAPIWHEESPDTGMLRGIWGSTFSGCFSRASIFLARILKDQNPFSLIPYDPALSAWLLSTLHNWGF